MFLRTLFEQRAHPSQNADWYRLLFGFDSSYSSAAGKNVDADSAMDLTAVWSAATQVSQGVATLPLNLYRRIEPRGKKKATNKPLHNLMHLKPNPEQTSVQFREAQMYQLLFWGNFYAEKEIDGTGQIKALWPLFSQNMRIKRIGNELVYIYTVPEESRVHTYDRGEILHIAGFSKDGLVGINPINANKESLGLGLALNEYAGRFFSNGARPGLALEHPANLSDKAQERLRKNWEQIHGGVDKSHKLAVLEEGMKLHEYGFSASEAQSLESRKFSVVEVARIFNIPPHMLKDLDRATYSNIAEQSEEFVVYCLRPWLVRLEQSYNTQLLSEKDSQRYFFEHQVDGLLRGTFKDRYASYVQGRQWGWLSADDVREFENMNPIPAGGDIYLVPLNMVPADKVGEVPEMSLSGKPESKPTEPEE